MRTVVEKFNVYKYEELSEKAKEVAISEYADCNTGMGWDEFYLENEVEFLNTLGFKDSNINYSGFWSQGDGASFTCEEVDLDKVLKAINFKFKNERMRKLVLGVVEVTITRSGYCRYYHENSTQVSIQYNLGIHHSRVMKALDEIIENLENAIGNYIIKLNRQIYKALEEAYEVETSEERVAEAIEINEIEFLENGKTYVC